MNVLIKKFVSSPFCSPKLTYTSGDAEFTADFSEKWGPEFDRAVRDVEELATGLFHISSHCLTSMVLDTVSWAEENDRTKCRIGVDIMLENRSGSTVGPCSMKSPWLNEKDLGEIADGAVHRMEALREVCAEYIVGWQRAQLELFQNEEIARLFDGRATDVDDDLNTEGGESKIDNLNQQYLSDNPDIASRILSQKGGE